jgi:hypothetical protein
VLKKKNIDLSSVKYGIFFPRIIPAKLGSIWFSSFTIEDKNVKQLKTTSDTTNQG